MEDFDEYKAAKLMNKAVKEAFGVTYDEDELVNVIDIIWDWYDENGFTDLDFDADGDDEVDINKLIDYVRKVLAKDADSPVEGSHIGALVKAELDYENSLSSLA